MLSRRDACFVNVNTETLVEVRREATVRLEAENIRSSLPHPPVTLSEKKMERHIPKNIKEIAKFRNIQW